MGRKAVATKMGFTLGLGLSGLTLRRVLRDRPEASGRGHDRPAARHRRPAVDIAEVLTRLGSDSAAAQTDAAKLERASLHRVTCPMQGAVADCLLDLEHRDLRLSLKPAMCSAISSKRPVSLTTAPVSGRSCAQLAICPMLVPDPGRACSHAAHEFGGSGSVKSNGECHERLRVL